MAITSLFGATPAQIMEARGQQQEEAIAGQGREFGVFAPLYQAGLRFGKAAEQGIVSGLFPEAADPMLKQAQSVQAVLQQYQGQDMKNPEVLSRLSSDLFAVGAPDAGFQAIKLARELAPKAAENKRYVVGGSLVTAEGVPLYSAPAKEDKEAIVKTPPEVARVASELGFGVRPNLADYSQAENTAINNLLELRGIKRAEAGVPKSGEVKVGDLATATKIIGDFTDKPREKLTTVASARSYLSLIKKGEGAALPQLQRELVKLVGDNQIAQGEVRAALGSAGIVGDTINAVNQFMTGVPTADKVASVEKVIDALESINASAYNRGRSRAAAVIEEAKFSDQTKKSLLPPEYKTGKEKKAASSSGFVEGKIYKDAAGNRARYVNGKWEPVQ